MLGVVGILVWFKPLRVLGVVLVYCPGGLSGCQWWLFFVPWSFFGGLGVFALSSCSILSAVSALG